MTTKTLPDGLRYLPNGRIQARFWCQGCTGHKGRRGQHTKVFDKQREAERWRRAEMSKADRGESVGGNKATVLEVAREQIAMRIVLDSTKLNYRQIVDKHLDGTPLGAMPINKVKPSHIEAWIGGLHGRGADPLKSGTERLICGVVKSVFVRALADDDIARNPWPRLERKPPSQPVGTTLTTEQLARLIEAIPERFRPLVLVQWGLGLRISEAVALHIEDVDFLRRRVTVRRQLAESGEVVHRLKGRQAHATRTIDLPQVVAVSLSEHLRKYPTDTGYIFTNRAGNVLAPNMYRQRTFGPALEGRVPQGV